MKNNKTANFFWHGSALTMYHHFCLESFFQNGFRCVVWAYNKNINLPDFCEYADAGTLMPEEELYKINYAGIPAHAAALSDRIRLRILANTGGWYFDTDMFCVESAETFVDTLAQSGILAGYEYGNSINNAVLCIPDASLADALILESEKICRDHDNVLAWGQIGPDLLTKFINNNNLTNFMLREDQFYPVNHWESMDLLNAACAERLQQSCSFSLAIHLTLSNMIKHSIDLNVMPPAGSYLAHLFDMVIKKRKASMTTVTPDQNDYTDLINQIAGWQDPFYYEYLPRLRELNQIIKDHKETMEGNIFYLDRTVPGDELYQAFQAKRRHYALFAAANQVLVEIGFNAGHSALLALTANPDLTYVAADICYHSYTKPCYYYLKGVFGERLEFVEGDSSKTIPLLYDRLPAIRNLQTGFIVDGGHTVKQAVDDTWNVLHLAKSGDMIMIDDVDNTALAYVALLAQMKNKLTPMYFNAETQVIFRVN